MPPPFLLNFLFPKTSVLYTSFRKKRGSLSFKCLKLKDPGQNKYFKELIKDLPPTPAQGSEALGGDFTAPCMGASFSGEDFSRRRVLAF
jgi:hypothetical protein